MDWIWNRLHISLPDEWEMLQYSKNPDRGRCAFADRYQFRFEINWTRVPTPPDMERLISDYAASLLESRQPQPDSFRLGAWHGLSSRENECAVTRYSGYFSEISQLVEACFVYPADQTADSSAEAKILSSIHPAASENSCLPWRAFGLDWRISPELSLSRCSVSCGFAELSFCNQKLRTTQTFTRRGMLSIWMKESIDSWIEKTLPEKFTVVSKNQHLENGHAVCDIVCEPSSLAWTDILFGKRRLAVSALICPQDGRLYAATDLHRLNRIHPAAPLLACPCGVSITPGGLR